GGSAAEAGARGVVAVARVAVAEPGDPPRDAAEARCVRAELDLAARRGARHDADDQTGPGRRRLRSLFAYVSHTAASDSSPPAAVLSRLNRSGPVPIEQGPCYHFDGRSLRTEGEWTRGHTATRKVRRASTGRSLTPCARRPRSLWRSSRAPPEECGSHSTSRRSRSAVR